MNLSLRTWSLRSRLTLGIVILTAIAFATASFATQSLLKGYLISEVDKELIIDFSKVKVKSNGMFDQKQLTIVVDKSKRLTELICNQVVHIMETQASSNGGDICIDCAGED